MVVKDHFNRSVSRIGAIKKLEKFDEFATPMAILDHGMAGKSASHLVRAGRGRGERLSQHVHMRKSVMHVQTRSQKRSEA
jgi:hypothetical protein